MFSSNSILFKDLMIWLNNKIWKFGFIMFVLSYFIISLFSLISYKNDIYFSNIGHQIFLSIGITQMVVLCIVWLLKWLSCVSIEKDQKTFELILNSPISVFQFISWGVQTQRKIIL